jgi:hypothetical protein
MYGGGGFGNPTFVIGDRNDYLVVSFIMCCIKT